jgi:uncharacterized membrane protein YhaH (DUF805 family)
MNWFCKVIKQYADFKGRARRKEFWMFVLFNLIFCFVLGFIDGRLFGAGKVILSSLYSLAVLVPMIAVTVRRLHDTGKGGGWAFLFLVPVVGYICLLILCALEGEHGNNRFGVDPKTLPDPVCSKKG